MFDPARSAHTQFLLDAVERTGTAQVYEVDEQMAHLALQMTRGPPIIA